MMFYGDVLLVWTGLKNDENNATNFPRSVRMTETMQHISLRRSVRMTETMHQISLSL